VTKPISHDELRIPKTPDAEKVVRKRVQSLAASMGFLPEKIEDILTAVGEATLNAIEHSSRGDPTDTILIRFSSEPGAMEISVSSKGAPFVPSYVKPDIKAKIEGRDRPRGWGLFLIRQLADEVEYSSDNNVTTAKMKFLLNSAAPSSRSLL
jgi:serine/threonine-protein kinase RsbW